MGNIRSEAYSEIQHGSNRCAYEHAVSEICIPGSAADDQEDFPTFPDAIGVLQEAQTTTASEDSQLSITTTTIDNINDLATTIDEVQPSSVRPAFLSDEDAYPGSSEGLESGNTETTTPAPLDRDSWSIQGDYLVRTHKVPRTTLFTPLEVPEDPPPILLTRRARQITHRAWG